MKRSVIHEIAKGVHTLKRNVIPPIKPCPKCGEKPVFCRSYTCFGYCMAATDGIKQCDFKPKIEECGSLYHAVELWNTAVEWFEHRRLLRQKQFA